MNPIRVMVVDDSVVVRKIVTDVLSADPDIEVVGTAVNGKMALAKLDQLKPDLVTMDIEMPEMNGIEAVRAIRAGSVSRRVPIIMFSTLTERGASATLDALSAGANDYVTKPANVGSVGQSMESVREQLIPKIKAAHRPAGHPRPGPRRRARSPRRRPWRRAPARQEARRPRRRLLHRRPRGARPGAPQLPATCPCRSSWSSTCRRSSPASSPSGWTGSVPLRVVEAVDGAPLLSPARSTWPRRPPPVWSAAVGEACTPRSTRVRRRTSAARRSIRCSARSWPPTTAPSWPSSSPAWAPTAATAPARSAPPGGHRDRAGPGDLRRLGHARRDRPGRPRRRGPALDRIAEAIIRHLAGSPRPSGRDPLPRGSR